MNIWYWLGGAAIAGAAAILTWRPLRRLGHEVQVERARESVANLVGCKTSEIVFTSLGLDGSVPTSNTSPKEFAPTMRGGLRSFDQ